MQDLVLEDVYIYLLERATRQLKRHFHHELQAQLPGMAITSDQWIILKRISERQTINQREVAEVTDKDPASITRTVDLLEKKGWLVRQGVADDRRAYQLVLTPAGWEVVYKLTPLAKQIREDGLRGIPQAEVEAFKATLRKIYANVS